MNSGLDFMEIGNILDNLRTQRNGEIREIGNQRLENEAEDEQKSINIYRKIFTRTKIQHWGFGKA